MAGDYCLDGRRTSRGSLVEGSSGFAFCAIPNVHPRAAHMSTGDGYVAVTTKHDALAGLAAYRSVFYLTSGDRHPPDLPNQSITGAAL